MGKWYKKIKKSLFSLNTVIVLSIIALIAVTGSYFYQNTISNKPEGLLHTLKHDKYVENAAFSPDSRYIATTTYGSLLFGLYNVTNSPKLISTLFNLNGVIKIWDVESGRLIRTFYPDYIQHSMTNCVEFSPDSKLLAGSSLDGIVRIWDVDSGKLLHSLKHRPTNTAAPFYNCRLNFSNNGEMLATAVSYQNVRVWDVETGNLLQTYTHIHSPSGFKQEVYNGIFTNDDKQVITADGNVSAKVWDVKSGELLATFSNPVIRKHGSRSYVTLSNNGKLVLLYSDYFSPEIWDLKTGALLHVLSNDIESLQKIIPNYSSKEDIGSWNANFSHNNRFIVNGGFCNIAQVWDVRSGKLFHTLKHGKIGPAGNRYWVYSAVFSPDDKFILTMSSDGTAKVWETKSGMLVYIIPDPSPSTSGFKKAEFTNNGKYIFTTSADSKTVRIWKFSPNNYLSN